MYAHAKTNAPPAALQPTLCVLCRACVVISIDPSTARDLDDALHVQVGGVSSIKSTGFQCSMNTRAASDSAHQVLDDGNIEVGVHIADVSFFVRPGTALDAEAQLRSTTV